MSEFVHTCYQEGSFRKSDVSQDEENDRAKDGENDATTNPMLFVHDSHRALEKTEASPSSRTRTMMVI